MARAVLLNNVQGNFVFSALRHGGVYAGGAEAVDVDGDDRTDLVVANWGSGTVAVLFGDGHGGFSPTAGLRLRRLGSASCVVGDFDGDGRRDIAVGNDERQRRRAAPRGPTAGRRRARYRPARRLPQFRPEPAFQHLDLRVGPGRRWNVRDGWNDSHLLDRRAGRASYPDSDLAGHGQLGLTSTDTATIYVRNVAPTITDLSIDSTSINVGGTVTLAAPSLTRAVRIPIRSASNGATAATIPSSI